MTPVPAPEIVQAVEALQRRALQVRGRYATWERQTYGREWTTRDLIDGLVVDVGDLTRLAMAHDGVRHVPDAKARLGHELADCLWAVLVLADRVDVDLASAFARTMDEIESSLGDPPSPHG